MGRVQSGPAEDTALPYVVALGRLNSTLEGREHRARSGTTEQAFSSRKELKSALPARGLVMSWLTIEPEGTLPPRTYENDSLLMVLDGKAQLTGGKERIIEQGDVVSLPGGCVLRIAGIGTKELQALLVTFEKAIGTQANDRRPVCEVDSLERLLEENETHAKRVLDNPYFRMIAAGGLDNERIRGLFRDRLRVFCDAFQQFLFARQATCNDEAYERTFLEHLLEELGHNDLMKTTGEKRPFDAVLSATSNWFCHQMFIQDNVGKAAIHLVLETGGDYFHNLAKPSFEEDSSSEYFETHAEDDARHKQMSIDLLSDQRPLVYRRLHGTVVDSWNMIDAMTRRIHKLVQSEVAAS